MNKLFFFFMMIFLMSCNTHSSDNIDELRYKQYVLQRSIETIKLENHFIYKNFAVKLSDPMSKTTAERWSSKINEVNSRSKFINEFIDSVIIIIKSDTDSKEHSCKKKFVQSLFHKKHLNDRLYDSFKYFQKALLQIDKESEKVFADEIIIPKNSDSSLISNDTFFKVFFEDRCQSDVLNNLFTFQNALLTLENKYATFFNLKSAYHRDHFDVFSAIIGQSSTIVMPGQEFSITAGVGAFSVAASPCVTINGEKQKINEEGVLNKKIKASTTLGSHSLPVSIEYTSPDGNRNTASYEIVYRVVKALEK